MRLNQLHLTRYGMFTDRGLDFGRLSPGAPDLHILYGPNEAGKSTALSAWLDLLYGIPAQSRYGFLHPYPTMRVGAALEIDGNVLGVARTKGRTNTLVDAATGAPLPETVLRGGLGGIDRAAYEAMFSLDDDTLEAGGDSILASQGDLGQLLFSASAGLAGLSATLDDLRRDADMFHRSAARSGGLSDLKSELAGIDDRRRAIDTQAGEYARLTEARAQAEAAWTEAREAQARTAAALEAVRRLIATLPAAGRLTRVNEELGPLAGLPEPPPGWAEALPDLAREEGATAALLGEIEASITRFEAELEGLVPDPAALELVPRVKAAETLKSAHDEAVKDLPNRRANAAETERTIAGLLGRLGHPGRAPRALLPGAAITGGLRGLIERRSGVEARLLGARTEAAEAARRQREAESKLADAGGGTEGTEALAALIAALRARNPAQALRQAERQADAAQQALTPRLDALGPWTGSGEDLSRTEPPSRETLDMWARGLEAAERAGAEAEGTLAWLGTEAARHEARLAARQISGRLKPEDVAEARAQRERLWAEHRRALTEATADAFEVALRRDDQVTARQAAAGADETRFAETREALALLRIDLAEAERARESANTEQTRITADMASAIGRLSPALAEGMTPNALRDWLSLRMQALAAHAALIEAWTVRDAAERELDGARQALIAGLATAGVAADRAAPYDVLVAQAQALADAGARVAALREALAEARRDLARRDDDLARAEAADREWHADWTALCADTWLAEGALPDVPAMGEILTALDALDRAVTQQDELADRITKMEANRAAFRDAATDLGAALALPPADPVELWSRIADRIARADDTRKTRDRVADELRKARENRAGLQDKAGRLATRIAEMAGFFGVTGLTRLRECLASTARRADLMTARAGLEQEIREGLGCDDLAEALRRLSEADRTALDQDRARLTAEAEQQGLAAQETFARLSEAKRQIEAVGGDDAVARLDAARQNVLLEMAERARRHLRQRFGIIAVEHALRAYRDSHRSAMMHRASEAFKTISRGAYTGLAAQPGRDREVLVALAADGGSKMAQDLSKGTRFQLYLALRVAGYHEFARARRPVPFIADDIMETFDDDRSAEAFTLLAGMARVGQVIYLTHHRHLCEIAAAVCPAATIHELGQPGPAGQ